MGLHACTTAPSPSLSFKCHLHANISQIYISSPGFSFELHTYKLTVSESTCFGFSRAFKHDTCQRSHWAPSFSISSTSQLFMLEAGKKPYPSHHPLLIIYKVLLQQSHLQKLPEVFSHLHAHHHYSGPGYPQLSPGMVPSALWAFHPSTQLPEWPILSKMFLSVTLLQTFYCFPWLLKKNSKYLTWAHNPATIACIQALLPAFDASAPFWARPLPMLSLGFKFLSLTPDNPLHLLTLASVCRLLSSHGLPQAFFVVLS